MQQFIQAGGNNDQIQGNQRVIVDPVIHKMEDVAITEKEARKKCRNAIAEWLGKDANLDLDTTQYGKLTNRVLMHKL